MRRYAFWKPDPIPLPEDPILAVSLSPMGSRLEVLEDLLTIPGTLNAMPGTTPSRVIWDRGKSVMLEFDEEETSWAQGQVMTIRASSNVDEKLFWRLYVQIHERLSAVLVDAHGTFLTTRQFRKTI